MAATRRATTTVYQDKSGEWRWHLALNGRTMADSGEGYKTPAGAAKAFARVALLLPTSSVVLPPKRQRVLK